MSAGTVWFAATPVAPAVPCSRGCGRNGVAHHSHRGWIAGPCESCWDGNRAVRRERQETAAAAGAAANGGAA